MRHAFAGDYMGKEGKDPSNLKKPLKQDGIDAVNALASWMADPKRNEVPNSIVCSPILRAVQTAKIMSDAFGIKYTIDQTLEISKPMEMLVKKYCDDSSITRPLIIAHRDNIEPGLARLNYLSNSEVDPIAMAELRIFKIDRGSCMWKEKSRRLPSDLGCLDYY